MRFALAVVLVSLALSNAPSASGQVVVPATANIFGAGHSVPPEAGRLGAGTLPTVVSFTPGH